jgi:hypothetical protein
MGVMPVLGLPWVAEAVDSNDGHQGAVELMGEAFGRWFTASGVTGTGNEVLAANGRHALMAVCLVSALLAVAMLAPGLRMHMRGLVKLVPVAAPLIVLVLILSEAHRAEVEPRWGAFAALVLTVFMASAAIQAGEMRERKAAPQQYTPGAGRAF